MFFKPGGLESDLNENPLFSFHRIFAIPKGIRTRQQRTAYNNRLMGRFSCYQKTTKIAETTLQIHRTITNIILIIRKIETGTVLCLVGKTVSLIKKCCWQYGNGGMEMELF